MSKAQDHKVYSADSETIRKAIIDAGQAQKLQERQAQGNMLELGEPFSIFSFRWPAKLVASIGDKGGAVAVDYTVSNFGFGPIQAGHVKKILAGVTSALEQYEKS